MGNTTEEPIKPALGEYMVDLPAALDRVMEVADFRAACRSAGQRTPLPMTGMLPRRLADAGAVTISQFDLERMLGTNDLVGIEFLERGMRAARSVARIMTGGARASYATGFLVAPRLMLTNRHVLPDLDTARSAIAEFGYEFDESGLTKQTQIFRLKPDDAFIIGETDDLDFALVAVAPTDERTGTALADYGYLRLDAMPRKVVEMEFVTLIQHPNGEHKQVALRENQVIKRADERPVILYRSDTAPGSSGSPCFNDQWQVVGLHSRGVPKRTPAGKVLVWGRPEGVSDAELATLRNAEIEWEANMGVRISAIVAAIRQNPSATGNPLVQGFLQDIQLGGSPLAGGKGATGRDARPWVAVEPAQPPPSGPAAQEAKSGIGKGYDPAFLSTHVPLPSLTEKALAFGEPSIFPETGDIVIPYTHFSIVHNATRRLAFLTAVNINGRRPASVPRSDDFRYDERIPKAEQAGNALYKETGENFFDRGHLVRRQDPVWGDADEASRANSESFYWTNIAPQYFKYNQQIWAELENYILNNAKTDRLKLSVFTGPVFSDSDLIHRGVPIPKEFWKVVVVELPGGGGALRSSAYRVSQDRFVTASSLPEEALPVGKVKTYQTTVAAIEDLTGIEFDPVIKSADVLGRPQPSRRAEEAMIVKVEGASGDKPLQTADDVVSMFWGN